MALTGALRVIATKQCPHCKKDYGDHSKKGLLRCLYTANYNLYNVVMEYNKLKSTINSSSEPVPATAHSTNSEVVKLGT